MVEGTAVILVDGAVDVVSQLAVHLDSHCVAGPYEQVHKEPAIVLTHSLEVIHEELGKTLFATLRSNGDSSDMSMPFAFCLFAFNLA